MSNVISILKYAFEVKNDKILFMLLFDNGTYVTYQLSFQDAVNIQRDLKKVIDFLRL